MREIQIKAASMEDRDSIYEMICLLEDEVLDKPSFDRVFEHNMENRDIFYIIAVGKDRIVGFASLHIQLLLHHSGPVAEIQELIVMPETRGLGIGAVLVRDLKRIAREKNCLILEVSCNLTRESAHRFYLNQELEQSHYKFVGKMTPDIRVAKLC